jgi:hypothetical protein
VLYSKYKNNKIKEMVFHRVVNKIYIRDILAWYGCEWNNFFYYFFGGVAFLASIYMIETTFGKTTSPSCLKWVKMWNIHNILLLFSLFPYFLPLPFFLSIYLPFSLLLIHYLLSPSSSMLLSTLPLRCRTT